MLHTFQDRIGDDHSSGNLPNLNDVHIGLSYFRLSDCACCLGKFLRKMYNVKALNLPQTSVKVLQVQRCYIE
ncbi:hypothetical protein Pint_04439 [Pistacia integerrima]|uniref:Uncharacterized protein n=1 Tax=Pistacia integerrima TaxID=434235 RepID=A0ACC0Z6W8_9ROSI|nr:hypothetical protein Pint_04439 [Pistacia integerrima]